MEKILKNERTNEQTNERSSERIEQKFMNEILSKTREIEEYPFNRLFRKFLQILGIAINYVLCEKKQEYTEKLQ